MCEEDKRLIMDVLAVIRVIREPDRLCTTWTVSPMDATGYTLMAYLPRPGQKNHVVEVTHDDISMIESVNIMRVRVGVVQFPSGAAGTWALKIRITSHRCPVPSLCSPLHAIFLPAHADIFEQMPSHVQHVRRAESECEEGDIDGGAGCGRGKWSRRQLGEDYLGDVDGESQQASQEACRGWYLKCVQDVDMRTGEGCGGT